MKKYIIYLLILGSVSCNNDLVKTGDRINNETLTLREEAREVNCQELEDTAIILGNVIGEFTDELFADGYEEVIRRNIVLNSISESLTFDEQIDTISVVFSISRSVVYNYFNTIYSFKSYLLNENNKDRVIDGIYCYAVTSYESKSELSSEQSAELQYRFIFGFLARSLGSPDCGFWNLMGSCADAAISVAAAATAPNPLSIGGAIGSIAAYGEQLSKC